MYKNNISFVDFSESYTRSFSPERKIDVNNGSSDGYVSTNVIGISVPHKQYVK